MKSTLFVLFTLCNGLIYSQNQGIEIPSNIKGYFVYKVANKERISEKLVEYEEYSPEELTTKSKYRYHIAVSSCKLYLGRDSSLYHFKEAYKYHPKETCESLRTRHNYFIDAIEKSKETGVEDGYIKTIKEETGDSVFSWYLWDLPNFDEFAFIDSCNQKYPIKKVEPIVKDSTLNSEIIRRRDQKYRSVGNLEKQYKLDQVNRDFIDSLYLIKGSLKEFEEDEIEQISWVAHHSDDCNWVYKWTERFIGLYDSGYKGKSLIDPLLDRMLDKKEGYCTKLDAQKRDYFIYMIKDKYPEFVRSNKLDW